MSISLLANDVIFNVGSVLMIILSFLVPVPTFVMSVVSQDMFLSFLSPEILGVIYKHFVKFIDFITILQLVVFAALLNKQLPLHYFTWSKYTFSQHLLNVLQLTPQYIVPKFAQTLLPLLAFHTYSQDTYSLFPQGNIIDRSIDWIRSILM
jgi:hypothetical protein